MKIQMVQESKGKRLNEKGPLILMSIQFIFIFIFIFISYSLAAPDSGLVSMQIMFRSIQMALYLFIIIWHESKSLHFLSKTMKITKSMKSTNSFLLNQFSKQAEIMTYDSNTIAPIGLSFNINQFRRENLLSSIDFYSCQPATLELIKAQTIKWTVEEFLTLRGKCPFFSVLTSLDRKRMIHLVGWNTMGYLLTNVDIRFDQFRNRAAGPTGPPVAFLENSHMYGPLFSVPSNATTNILAQYPDTLISVDVFSCRLKESHNHVMFTLVEAINQLLKNEDQIPLPDGLISLQLLSSIDSASCSLIGVWEPDSNGYNTLYQNKIFLESLESLKSYVATGTYSDIVQKCSSRRLYTHVTIVTPPDEEGLSLVTNKQS